MADQPVTTSRKIKEPSYADAILPLVVLIVLIAASVAIFGLEAVGGPMEVALIVAGIFASLIALKNGYTWEDVEETGKVAFGSIVTPIFILFAVGALIGTWNMSGTIPTLVYYGMKLLAPSYFYVATAIICGLISMAIGSSWTTAGTIGVGLVGLATLVGVSPFITAGAVISGSYLGDKLSPISETTVLTAQLAEIDIYTHLRAQIWTSIPSFIIAIIVFAILGLRVTVAPGIDTGSELNQLDKLFHITPWNLIPLLVLVVLSIRKVPAQLAIMSAALVAGIMAPFLQREAVMRFINEPATSAPIASIKAIWLAMATGYKANSGIPVLDSLLSRGGMESMLTTLWIIVGAVTFGTILEEFKLLSKILDPLMARAKTTGRLIGTVVATALGLNIFAGDQYIALVLPSRLYRVEFRKRGLKPQNLSRTCADAGTVTSALVPWNSCGAFMAATLGVPTANYMPYAVFNIASPLMSLLWGITGIKVERIPPSEVQRQQMPPEETRKSA
jgi:Na+:H+ antiporter, NhaC family